MALGVKEWDAESDAVGGDRVGDTVTVAEVEGVRVDPGVSVTVRPWLTVSVCRPVKVDVWDTVAVDPLAVARVGLREWWAVVECVHEAVGETESQPLLVVERDRVAVGVS